MSYLYLLVPIVAAISGFAAYAAWILGKNPDLTIYNKTADGKTPYIHRWYLAINKSFTVFIHEFADKDNDLPHNHIGPMVSFVLAGRGREEFFNVLGAKTGERELKPGRIYFRGTKYPHLIHSSEDAPLQTLVFAWIGAGKNWGFFNTDGSFYPAKEYCRSPNFNKSS